MPTPLLNALLFLITGCFDLYIGILILRFLLAAIRIDYFNPLAQIIIRFTKFMINPLRKILPNIQNIETSTLLVILILEILKFYTISAISGVMPAPLGIFLLSIADFLMTLTNIIFYAVIAQALMSWIPDLNHSPAAQLIYRITAPFLRPFRRVVPIISGIDLSPLLLLVCLKLLQILFVAPLFAAANNFLG